MREGAAPDRYPGFAQVEYEHVRAGFFPGFEWRVERTPSPRHRPSRPLAEARVALVGSAGAYLTGQPRFSTGDEGDHSFREIPRDAERLRLAHAGYDIRRALRDPGVVFPLELLRTLERDGTIGELAPRAVSLMGYIPDAGPLLAETAPAVARTLIADEVDLALLVPA